MFVAILVECAAGAVGRLLERDTGLDRLVVSVAPDRAVLFKGRLVHGGIVGLGATWPSTALGRDSVGLHVEHQIEFGHLDGFLPFGYLAAA